MPTRKRARLLLRRKKKKKVLLEDGILVQLNYRAKPLLMPTELLQHKALPPPTLRLPQLRSPSLKITAAHTPTTLRNKLRKS